MAAEVNTEGSGSVPAEDYECKICYNYFDLDLHVPKLLSCSHTFCRGCLEALHVRDGGGWRLGCPVCRHRTRVPDYRVHNLPDNVAVMEALPRCETPEPDYRRTGVPLRPAYPTAAEPESESGCHACKQVAFRAGCVCAVFSLLSTGVLLLLGLVFVHNFNDGGGSQVGPACLFVSSLLALFSLVLTWLLCLLRFRPEAGESSSSSSFTTLR